ncbi:MAG: hypothetical protein LBP22_07105 [Deltaproteobacteria bacterium]|jgi:hypothetical protein|nr:hypothetical protein [Deltaproteobacteria bacterium]
MNFAKNLVKSVNLLWVIVVLMVLAAVGWALDGLEAQSNKVASDAGGVSADMSMASLDTIKAPKRTASKPAPNVNWARERQVKNSLTSQERSLTQLINRGKSEAAASGSVSSGLANQLRAAAQRYQQTSQEYSDIWAAGNCTTRAKLALEAGNSQMAAVELMISGADGDKISDLKSAQSRVNDARRAYIREAIDNGEFSDADMADLRRSIVPRANQLVREAGSLVTEVTGLLDQIRSQVQSMASPAGLTSCATGAISGGGPENIAQKLLSPVTNLLSLAQGLATNASDLVSDIGMLR